MNRASSKICPCSGKFCRRPCVGRNVKDFNVVVDDNGNSIDRLCCTSSDCCNICRRSSSRSKFYQDTGVSLIPQLPTTTKNYGDNKQCMQLLLHHRVAAANSDKNVTPTQLF